MCMDRYGTNFTSAMIADHVHTARAHPRANRLETAGDRSWLKPRCISLSCRGGGGRPITSGGWGGSAVRHREERGRPSNLLASLPARAPTRVRTPARLRVPARSFACTCLHSCARPRSRAPRRAFSAHAACAPEWECLSGQSTACARESLLALWLPARTR